MNPIAAMFILGAVIGAFSCGVVCRRKRRQYMRQTAELMRSSSSVQDGFYATMSMVFLSSLQKLESGNVSAAQRELIDAIVNFYVHFHASADTSPWIASQIREIEFHARFSESLRAAMSSKSSSGFPTP